MLSFLRYPLLLGLILLGCNGFAQDTTRKLKPLNNHKHQQHKKRVQVTKPSAQEEELESGTARNQHNQVFILRIRRNKNRTMRPEALSDPFPADAEATREVYRNNRRKRKALKKRK